MKQTPITSKRPVGELMLDTIVGACKETFKAAQTPFVDLGIKRQKIPKKLEEIQPAPYALREQICCESIPDEIAQLDAILGQDVDALPWQRGESDSYADKGSRLVQQQAAGFMEGQVNVLPYRGVVRKLSGAEKHARKTAAAIHAGNLRRAFYKGLGVAYGCFPAPSAQKAAPTEKSPH